jgi:hypothetical protein
MGIYRQLLPKGFFPPMRWSHEKHELPGHRLRCRLAALVGCHRAVSQHVCESVYLLLGDLAFVENFAVPYAHSAIDQRFTSSRKCTLLNRYRYERDSVSIRAYALTGHADWFFTRPNRHGLIFQGSTIATINESHSNLLRTSYLGYERSQQYERVSEGGSCGHGI